MDLKKLTYTSIKMLYFLDRFNLIRTIMKYMKNVNKKETSELFPPVRQPFPLDELTLSLSVLSLSVGFLRGGGQGA